MKNYEKPELVICSLSQDVITSSKEMSFYDDKGDWVGNWSNWTGGNS